MISDTHFILCMNFLVKSSQYFDGFGFLYQCNLSMILYDNMSSFKPEMVRSYKLMMSPTFNPTNEGLSNDFTFTETDSLLHVFGNA